MIELLSKKRHFQQDLQKSLSAIENTSRFLNPYQSSLSVTQISLLSAIDKYRSFSTKDFALENQHSHWNFTQSALYGDSCSD